MKAKLVVLAVAVIAFIAVILDGIYTVGENERVVVTNFGEFQKVSDPGFKVKMPIAHSTYTFRVDTQEMYIEKTNVYTVDNQSVDVWLNIFYRIPAENVEKIFRENRDYKTKIHRLVEERTKATFGRVNTTDAASKRAEIRNAVIHTVKEDARNLLGVEIMDIQLTNIEYSPAFAKAVENAVIAKTKVEEAEQLNRQAEVVARTAAIQALGSANAAREAAKGQADATKVQAEADAYAIRVNGEATASAIKSQAEALKASSDLVELRKAERWDGKLPVNVYAGAPIPFLNAPVK